MNQTDYIEAILNHIHADRKTLKRIEEDLKERIECAIDQDPYYDPLKEMGPPEEVAAEFMDNLNQKDRLTWASGQGKAYYEYTSKTHVFGIPLVHINISGKKNMTRVAKGIIAVGDVSLGLCSAGGLSLGLISVGGLSFGLVALGGLAIGGLALGGISLGLMAGGGIALGIFKAFGGLSVFL